MFNKLFLKRFSSFWRQLEWGWEIKLFIYGSSYFFVSSSSHVFVSLHKTMNQKDIKHRTIGILNKKKKIRNCIKREKYFLVIIISVCVCKLCDSRKGSKYEFIVLGQVFFSSSRLFIYTHIFFFFLQSLTSSR